MDIVKIYLIIGLLWGVGLHAYALLKLDLWATFNKKQKFYRIPVGVLFNTILWPLNAPFTIKKIIKKEPVSMTLPNFL